MINITVDKSQIRALMSRMPKETTRAASKALDRTALAIRDTIKDLLPRVFDRPNTYTMNSLKVTLTQKHNGVAYVWFKDPERMKEHYLVPQVRGGMSRLKGFERALGGRRFVAGRAARLDRFGNMSVGQIRQILSVLGRAELTAGYMANKTARSERLNRKDRDYVWLKKGHGKLPPGVYERFQTGVGFGAKTKKTMPFGVYQKGRTKGRFSSVIRAKGLRPVLIETRARAVTPNLPFYKTAEDVFSKKFFELFSAEFAKRTGLKR